MSVLAGNDVPFVQNKIVILLVIKDLFICKKGIIIYNKYMPDIDNYLHLCDRKKWFDTNKPITVYIGYYHLYDTVSAQNTNTCIEVIKKAFYAWQSVLDNKIRFDILANGGHNIYKSQINIVWRPSNILQGETSLDYQNNYIFGAEIKILIPANYINFNSLYHVAISEIGKALGLANSNNPNDITYTPYNFQNNIISSRDINTLNLLYDFIDKENFVDTNNIIRDNSKKITDDLETICKYNKLNVQINRHKNI